MKQQITKWLGISLLHLVLAIMATYPSILHFKTHVIGSGDIIQNAWNIWWFGQGIDPFPFYTSMLYHPEGVSLAYHTLAPLNGWLGVLFHQGLQISLPITLNIIIWISFVLSGLAMFGLAYQATNSKTAAFTASLIFVYAPFRLSRVHYGNLNLYSTHFLPILAYCLLYLNRWPYAIGAGLSLALTGWYSLELAFGAGLFTAVWFIFNPKPLKLWGIVGLTTFVFMLPIVIPMFQYQAEFAGTVKQPEASMGNSADLLGYFVPDPYLKPILAYILPTESLQHVYSLFYGNGAEKTVFIGYVVLIMVIIAMLASPYQQTYRWVFIAILFFLLGLGPTLYIAGQPVWHWMPYKLFHYLPLISSGRTPSRLAIFLMLSLAMIIAYGCANLEKRWLHFKYVTLFIGLLIYSEFLTIPVPLDHRLTTINPYYHQLAQETEPFAILNIPIDLYGAPGPAGEYMGYQIVHQKPIVSGYISRTPHYIMQLFNDPVLNQLRARIYGDSEPYHFNHLTPTQTLKTLNYLQSIQVKYIILHKTELSLIDVQVIHDAITILLTNPPHYEDLEITVWRLPLAS